MSCCPASQSVSAVPVSQVCLRWLGCLLSVSFVLFKLSCLVCLVQSCQVVGLVLLSLRAVSRLCCRLWVLVLCPLPLVSFVSKVCLQVGLCWFRYCHVFSVFSTLIFPVAYLSLSLSLYFLSLLCVFVIVPLAVAGGIPQAACWD